MMQRFRRLKPIAILVGPLVLAACGRHSADDRQPALESRIRQIVHDTTRPPYVTRDRDGSRLWKLTRTFYERREFAPAWIQDRLPKPHVDALLRAIRAADREGLDPELYSASLLDQRKTEASSGFLTKRGFDPEVA